MNRNAHRVVFNAKRGQLMVVAETAQSQSSSSASGQRASASTSGRSDPAGQNDAGQAMRTLCKAIQWVCQSAAVWAGSASLCFPVVQAQTLGTRIVPDSQAVAAQQATVLKPVNGVVQVNIQTPSSAGVSRNSFSQFDVGASGVVINNSRTSSSSQLMGSVQANPWLARGVAKVILTEVNAKDPSQIQGAVEVAGQRAEMVMANPSGIVVNGGKFINASQVTLSTGQVAMGANGLLTHQINQGQIAIEGKGLDTRDADYTRILGQAVQVNAQLWAQDLKVVTGNNQIQTHDAELVVTARKDRPTDAAKPMFALDVKQLGGMYAGKILLMGTENGLGVNNAGVMQASAGPLTLQSNGWLSNSGVMHAQGDLSIQTQGRIEHSGSITAQAQLNMVAQGAQATVQASAGSLLAAGMDMQSQVMPKGDMTVQAQGGAALHGQVRSAGDMAITAAQLQLSQSALTGQRIELNATQTQPQTVSPAIGIDLQQAQVRAQGPLHITTNDALQTDSADIAGQSLKIQAQSLSNRDGKMVQTGPADQQLLLAGALDNTGGTLKTNAQSLTLSAAALHNAGGHILHAGSGPLTLTTGQLDNTQGSIGSAGNTQLSAAGLNNAQGKIYAQGQQSIQVQGVLSHQGAGALIAAQGQQTLAAQQLQSGAGSLIASGLRPDGSLVDTSAAPSASLDLQVREGLQLQGDVMSAGALSMQAGSLVQGGRAVAQGGIQAKADVVYIDGQLQAGGALKLQSGSTLQLNGQVQSLGDAQLFAVTDAHLRGSLVARGALNIEAQRYTNHAQGSQTSVGATTIQSPGLIDLQGQTTAGTQLNLISQNTQLQGPLLAAQTAVIGQDITLGQAGKALEVAGALSLNMQGQVQIQSDLSTGGNLHITSAGATHVAGSVRSAGAARLQAAGPLSIDGAVQAAQAVSLISNGQVQVGQGVQGSSVDISGQSVQVGQSVVSSAGSLDIRSGHHISIGQQLYSAQDLSLSAAGAIVVQGPSTSLGNTRMASNADIVLQQQATAVGAMQLSAGGQLQAKQSLVAGAIGIQAQDVQIAQNLQSGGAIDVLAKTLQVGRDIESGQSTRIVATGGSVTAQNMRSLGDIEVQAQGDVKADSFSAQHNLNLTSQTAGIQTGQVLAGGALQMQASGDISATDLYAQGPVKVHSDQGKLSMASVQSQSAIDMAAGQSIQIQGPVVSAQAMNLQAAGALDVQGAAQSGGAMTMQGQSLVIGGPVYSGADLHMQASAGDITLNDNMQARGNASMTGQNIQLQGAQVLGDLDMQAQGVPKPLLRTARMAPRLLASPAASATTGGNIVSHQSILVGGGLSIQTPGSLQVQGHIGSGKSMDITAGGAVHAAGVIVSGLSQTQTQTSNALAHMHIQTAQGLDAQSIRSQGDMNLSVGGSVQTGAMLALGQLSAQAQGDLLATGGIQGQDVAVESAQGDIQTAQVVSHGDLKLQAAQNITTQDIYAGTQSTHTSVLTAGQNIHTGSVQNQGQWSANAQGDMVVQGDLISAGSTHLSAEGRIDNQGHVWSGGDLTETAGTDITHKGDTAANGSITLNSGGAQQLGTASTSAAKAGGVRAAGAVTLQAGQALKVAGSVQANGPVDITSQAQGVHIGADLSTLGALNVQAKGPLQLDGSVHMKSGTLASELGAITIGKDLKAQNSLSVTAAQNLSVLGKTAVGGNLALHSTGGSVSVGALQVAGHADLVARQNLTLAGPSLLLGTTQFTAQEGSLNIFGNMQLAGDFYIRQSGDFNQQGLITSRGNIDIEAGNITSNTVLEGGLQAGGQLNLKAARYLTLGAKGQYVGINSVNTAAWQTYQAGLLQTNGVYSSANWLNNTGTINARSIEQAAQLVNSGQISAASIQAGSLSNRGQVVGQTMDFGFVDNTGIVQGQNITMGSLSNSGRVSATGSIYINGHTDNSGILGAVGSLSIQAGEQTIFNEGQMLGADVDLQAQKLSNFGTIQAGTQLSVQADQVINGLKETPVCMADYRICGQYSGERPLQASDFMWVQQRGILSAGQNLHIQAGQMVNAGVVKAVGQLELDMAQALINIRSENDLQSFNNQPTAGSTNAFKPSTQTGLITAGGDMTIKAQSFDNVRGQVLGKQKVDITTEEALNNVRANPSASIALLKDAFIQRTDYGNYKLIPPGPQTATDASAKDEFAPIIQGTGITLKASAIVNEGLVHATRDSIEATATQGDIVNKGLAEPDPLAPTAAVQSTQVQSAQVQGGQWVAQKKLQLTAELGDIVNGKAANLLANDEITLKAKDFTNDGTLFGLQSAVKKIDITTSGNVYNNKDAIIIADQELNLNITSGHNKGTIGSFGDLTLNAPTVDIGIVDNPLIAKKKLTLNVDRVTVGLGQSWVSDAEQVSWTGKLYNNGSVILSGTAQGDVDNLSSGLVARTDPPNQGALAGSYKLIPPVFNLGKDTVVVGHELQGYSDVQNRAFFQSAGLTGHLRNFASDVVGGVSTYEPISVPQASTWLVSYKQTAPGPDQDAATFDPNKVLTTTVLGFPTANPTPSSGTAESLARLYLPKPASITLVGPKPGTIVGQDVSISGDDLVLDNSSQPGTNTAGSAAVNPGAAQTVGPAASTTVQVTAQNTDLQAVQGMQPGVTTPGQGAWVGPVSFAVPTAATLGGMTGGATAPLSPLTPNTPATPATTAAGAAAVDGQPQPLNLNLGAAQTAAQALGAMNAGNAPVDWAALAPVTGSVKADTLTLKLTGLFTNIGPLLVNNALTIDAAKGINNSGATIDAGILNINSHDGFLNNNGGTINAKTLTTDIAGKLNNTDGKISVVGDADIKAGDVVATNGFFESTNGNFTLDSTGNIVLLSSHVSALQNVGLHATGKILIDSLQYDSQSTDANGVTKRLRETDQSGISSANGNVSIVGLESVDLDASNVAALNGTLRIHSEGTVDLGFNTDVDQQNWTTVDVRRSWYGKKTVTTTDHEVTEKTAVVTDLQAKNVVVTGANVYVWGSEITGSESTYVAGKDKTLIYTVDNVKTVTANSNKSSSFLGFDYSNKDSQGSLQDTSALKPTLSSDTVITLGVGNEANLNGAVFNAPTINIVPNPEADPSTQAHLTLGLALDTQVTSHTETDKTLGVWQKQSGAGGTTQTGTAPSFNGNLSIDPSLVVTVQLPEGDLKNQIEALSQQPGMGYLKDLASNPKIKWDQVKLAHDQWSYSQQGLTPAGAALLSIAVAVATGGTAAGFVNSLGFTGATATAMTAGMTALASSASVSFVNNGGDIGQTLKDLGSKESVKNIALAMVTAGALSELNASLGLDKVTVKDGFVANLNKAVINNLATAGINSALTGTDLEDNIKTALVSAFISAGSGQAANEIGNLTQDSQVLKALAHALAGCMAGGASGGKQGCESGAIGAVVGELAAQWYDPNGSKPPQDTLNFVKVVSAAAGAITGDGSAESVSTAVMTGVNAAMNNRLMHFDEKERIRIAAGGDAEKQERLTKAACFEIKCWAQFPEGSDLYKANYVSVAEISGLQAEWDWVKAQKNFGAFAYTPSQKFTDWVASNTGLASGTLNGKVLGTGANKICGNGDTSCLTGIGQQQNPALTEAEKQARAEYFGNLGEEYQRSANLAASMRLPQVALSYEIAAGVTALLEQAYQPSLGKVVVDTLLVDEAVSLIAKESGVPLLYVQEIADKMIKPKLESLRQWLDGVGK